MSFIHLSTGSEQPPKVDGKLRLYSMEYCPYAQRVRLVLRAKNIAHDVVNVDLINKPEWLFKLHPEGKVPVLDTGSEIIVESLTIADFLENEYPEPALYPAEPQAKENDKELIKKMDALISTFSAILFQPKQKTTVEWFEELLTHLKIFEAELEKRGTTFFSGDKPGMVDYMLWPWGERAGTIALILGEKLPLAENDIPLIRAWRKVMKEEPVASGIYHGPVKFHKVVLFKTGELPPDYENI